LPGYGLDPVYTSWHLDAESVPIPNDLMVWYAGWKGVAMPRFSLLFVLFSLFSAAPGVAQTDAAAQGAVCAGLDEQFAHQQADLQRILPGQKREVDAWYEQQIKNDEDSRWNPLEYFFGPSGITPPRVAADYSKNTGALDCLTWVLSGCDGRRGGPTLDPEQPQHVAAFNTISTTWADQIEARADQDWMMSVERKDMVKNASDAASKLRWLAEANALSGFATECRGVAQFLRDGLLPEPTSKRPPPAKDPKTCSDLDDLPGGLLEFCIMPPGDDEEDLHFECCKY